MDRSARRRLRAPEKGHKEIYRGGEYEVNFVPKILVEVAAHDQTPKTSALGLSKRPDLGNIGDGKVFVLDIGRQFASAQGKRTRAPFNWRT